MQKTLTYSELQALVGTELGTSEWFHIDQERINAFADVTVDHQFIHVDAARAAETPFGGTIAHGFLTLSLLVHLCRDLIPHLDGAHTLLNYGLDRVRFVAPVKSGKRVRARVRLAEVTERKPGQIMMKLDVSVEIEGEAKPALVAEWLSLHWLESAKP